MRPLLALFTTPVLMAMYFIAKLLFDNVARWPEGHRALYARLDDPLRKKAEPKEFPLLEGQEGFALLTKLAHSIAKEANYQWEYNEDWSFDPETVKKVVNEDSDIQITDDCDWQRSMLWVLRSLGWPDELLAEVGVDYNQEDNQYADHYIAAVFVPSEGRWYGFNSWYPGEIHPMEFYYEHVKPVQYHILSDRWLGIPLWRNSKLD